MCSLQCRPPVHCGLVLWLVVMACWQPVSWWGAKASDYSGWPGPTVLEGAVLIFTRAAWVRDWFRMIASRVPSSARIVPVYPEPALGGNKDMLSERLSVSQWPHHCCGLINSNWKLPHAGGQQSQPANKRWQMSLLGLRVGDTFLGD